MDEDVAHQVGGQKQELIVQADVFLARTTRPNGFLPSDGGFMVRKIDFLTDLP
jgi:hypothetical protein